MLWVKKIVCMFTLPGVLVVKRCAGTFSVAKECMFLPQDSKFVVCDLDSEYIASSLSELARIFACQALNKKSCLTEDDTLQHAVSTFLKAVEETDLERRINVW